MERPKGGSTLLKTAHAKAKRPMNRTLATVVLSAAVATGYAGVGAQEPEQTPGSQILVSDCYPHGHAPGTAHPWIDPYGVMHSAADFPYGQRFLAISFENTAQKVAKEIDFGLVAHGELVAVANDIGTFAPGKPVRNEFTISPQIFPIRSEFPYCAVLRVKYVDGTEWRIPFAPQERAVS